MKAKQAWELGDHKDCLELVKANISALIAYESDTTVYHIINELKKLKRSIQISLDATLSAPATLEGSEEAANQWASDETGKIDFVNSREKMAYYNGLRRGFYNGGLSLKQTPPDEGEAVELDPAFDKWLSDNRWYTYSPVTKLWSYTFEHGTAMGKESYRKNFMKTTDQLYQLFKQQNTKP